MHCDPHLLAEYRDGRLAPSLVQNLQAHISDCASCRARITSWNAIGTALKEPVPGAAPAFSRVTRRLGPAPRRPLWRIGATVTAAGFTAGLAAALLVFGGAQFFTPALGGNQAGIVAQPPAPAGGGGNGSATVSTPAGGGQQDPGPGAPAIAAAPATQTPGSGSPPAAPGTVTSAPGDDTEAAPGASAASNGGDQSTPRASGTQDPAPGLPATAPAIATPRPGPAAAPTPAPGPATPSPSAAPTATASTATATPPAATPTQPAGTPGVTPSPAAVAAAATATPTPAVVTSPAPVPTGTPPVTALTATPAPIGTPAPGTATPLSCEQEAAAWLAQFTSGQIPAGLGCLASAPTGSAALIQAFDRGTIYSLAETGEFLVLLADGSWTLVRAAMGTPAATPPDGRLAPAGMLVAAWAAAGGEAALGWARSTATSANTVSRRFEQARALVTGDRVYLLGTDGRWSSLGR